MTDETIIEDLGMWQWTLAVSGDDVIARVAVPHNGATVYSTHERDIEPGTTSQYGLSAREVVRRYVDESATDATFGHLIDRVQVALAGVVDQEEGIDA
jgi:hypothetical protein